MNAWIALLAQDFKQPFKSSVAATTSCLFTVQSPVFLTNRTLILFGTAVYPAKIPASLESPAAGGNHVAQF